jgi:hypothetical protein
MALAEFEDATASVVSGWVFALPASTWLRSMILASLEGRVDETPIINGSTRY